MFTIIYSKTFQDFRVWLNKRLLTTVVIFYNFNKASLRSKSKLYFYKVESSLKSTRKFSEEGSILKF